MLLIPLDSREDTHHEAQGEQAAADRAGHAQSEDFMLSPAYLHNVVDGHEGKAYWHRTPASRCNMASQ